MYGKYQCQISGNPTLNGNLVCDNDSPQPTTTVKELVTANVVNGNPSLTYNCNNKSASTRRFMGWMQLQGTP
jgi:hypothetical protein